ncbi:MAG: 50S ribosomal protein L16 [Candidatus Diapherotrites archaeon]
MGLRPGHCYHDPDKDRAYTRYAKRVPKKNFIGAVPGLRTRQFNMGNAQKQYEKLINLIIDERILIRDNAIESIRMLINRKLVKLLGKDGFFIKIRVYPFHILRENKQAQGAHADRIQTGMSHAFGKAIGRAVRAKKGQALLSVLALEKDVKNVKEILKGAKSRLPCKVKIEVTDDIKSIGSLPKKKKFLAEEEKKEETTEEEKGKETEKGKGKEPAKKDEGKGKKEEKGKEAEKKDDKGKDKKEQKKK